VNKGRSAMRCVARTAITLVSVAAMLSGQADAVSTHASADATSWRYPDHDLSNSRDASGSHIDIADAKNLQPKWEVPLAAGLATSPLIDGNSVFIEDQAGEVARINLTTGSVLWKSPAYGYSIGPYGVAVGWGKVFATTSTSVLALNERTGAELWSTPLTLASTDGVDVQPQLIGRDVIVSSVPVDASHIYTGGARGFVYAVSERTGHIEWRFDTVRSSDLWGNAAVNSGGGSWYPPSYSPSLGLLYVGIANPAPFVGTTQYPNGSSRPGRNLYTDSTVALKLRSGHLAWYRQATPHDIFDYDFVHTMVVRIPPKNGRPSRTVVVGTGKSGIVIGMDPVTGRQLWRTPVGDHLNDSLKKLSGPTEVLPGTFGGVLTPPASADGIVYVAALNAPDILSPDATAYFGGKTGTMPGDVVAIDARTGRRIWDTKVPGDPTGGVTVVNDLVLTATLQGKVIGLSRETGRIVFEETAPGGINGWMSISGNSLVIPVGLANPPILWTIALHDKTTAIGG
jgi:outer membrane protein assembly factor BamB